MDTRRSFNPTMVPGLSEDARKAVAQAFEAMATWRNEIAANGEKNSAKVFDKMGAAAKACGWPAQIVDATQQQMQSVTRMQMQMIDQFMDAWEEQLKSPNPMGAFPSAMMSKLQSLPGFPGMANFPGMSGFPGMEGMMGGATNPMQFWMQMGEQWQKNWAQAMQFWANAGMPPNGGKR